MKVSAYVNKQSCIMLLRKSNQMIQHNIPTITIGKVMPISAPYCAI